MLIIMMKKFNIVILSLFLFSCSVSKSSVIDTNIVESSKVRFVDTTLKYLNPIELKIKKDFLFDTTKIETKYYKVISYTDYDDNTRVTKVIPKNDSIKIKVKVKEIETKKETKINENNKKVVENSIEIFLGYFLIIFCVIIMLIILLMIYRREILKK